MMGSKGKKTKKFNLKSEHRATSNVRNRAQRAVQIKSDLEKG